MPIAGTRPFLQAIVVQNLSPNTAGETDVGTVSVIVAGPANTLAALTSDQVVVSVDAANRGTGTYPTDVVVRVPAGVTVQTVQPTRVTLTIRTR